MFDTLRQDLRHGVRMLAKNPGFAAVAIPSIAVGVGANAAMFSLADALVLRPLQVPRATEVVALSGNSLAATASTGFGINRQVSFLDYRDVRDRARSFEGLFAYRVLLTGLSLRADEPTQSTMGLAVSGNFFAVLGVEAAVGRTFRDDEDVAPGRDPVVVLSHATWTERFNSDPSAVGRRVRIGGVDLVVIGVTPASFTGMHLVLHPAYYVPLNTAATLTGTPEGLLDRRQARVLVVKGRLAPGVSIEQAHQEANIIAADLERAYPDTNRAFSFLVRSDFDARVEERGPSAPGAVMLITLAVVVLLVACANVAGLLISRAPGRAKELAVRMAIGGGRLRVMRQLLTEGMLIAAAGAALGLAVGYVLLRWMQGGEVVSDIGVRIVASLDRRALGVGLIAAAASAIASSLMPAWQATRARDLTVSLRPGAASPARASRLWGRHGLVVGQVALSLMMLIVAVFVYRSFAAEFARPGFGTERMVLVQLNPELAGYDTVQTDAFYQRLLERARTLPSVRAAGLTSIVPLNQDSRDFSVIIPEGFELPAGTDTISVSSARIDEGYLDTIGIPLVSGRSLRESDTAEAPMVAVVNQTMAERYWPGQDPIGKRLRVDGASGPRAQVVGVARDSKYNWIGETPTPFLYLARRQMGLGLSLVGLYSLMACAVARRTREIGIRMAIGALPSSVLRLVLGQGGWLVLAGVVLGILGSAAVGGLLRGILPSRGGIDLMAYAIVVPALIGVTLAAAYIPARRASRIDPLVALRQE